LHRSAAAVRPIEASTYPASPMMREFSGSTAKTEVPDAETGDKSMI